MPTAPAAALHLDPALLQRLKGIELRSRFLVRGLYHSRHRTSDFGSSTEFIEHREYRRGDELRTIDWKVFGRTNRYYVKVHEMEANMRVQLVLDTSASMRVPAPAGLLSKLELGSVIAGALAQMCVAQQDSAGLICLGKKVDEHLPCRQGNLHLSLLYRHLGAPKGDGGGTFGKLLKEAGARLGTRSVIFVLTDALDPPELLLDALKFLRVRQHDVTLVHLLDQAELDFPFDRMTEFRHPETGERVIGDPAALKASYLKRLHAHLDLVQAHCKKSQADYLRLSNADDLAKLLSLHLIRRLAGGVG